MALDVNITGPAVATDGSPVVALTQDYDASGYARILSESDAGQVTGAPHLLQPEVSEDYRLRVEFDSLMDYEKFNYTAQNTSKHLYRNTTMTNAWTAGALTTNSGNITTTTTGTLFQTYRHFPIFGGAQTLVDFKIAFTGTFGVTNKVIDVGPFTAAVAFPHAPVDGIFLRATSAGLQAVSCSAGVETSSASFKAEFGGGNFTPVIGTFYDVIVEAGENVLKWWINMRDADGYTKLMARTLTAGGIGTPTSAASLPFSVRDVNTGTTSAAMGARLASYTVRQGGYNTGRLWPTAMAGMGQSGVQGASGMTQGQTSNNTNSAAPASASLSNTAAGYTTMGGKFQFAAPGGAVTDFALFGYQVPAGAAGLTGRNLVIRGIWINTVNTGAAVATTATVLEWSLGIGSTAVSLATPEAATTRAPRRLSLGMQAFIVGAAIGSAADRIDVNLDAPVVAEPGTFVHVILQVPVGTATGSQILRGNVGINAYWE